MKVKILLVDDEKDFVNALAERLEVRSFYVMKASSGSEAVALLKEEDVDVVILDILMPGMDGLQTLQELKQINPLIEVILLTGHATVESAIKGMQMGAFYYLMKPVEMKNLLDKIANAYKRKAEHEERIRQAEIERILRSETGTEVV